MQKLEKIYVIILFLVLIGILATLGYFYFEKERSRNIEDIPLINSHGGISNKVINVEGKYFSENQGQGYYQKLEIAKNTGDSYRIAISYGGATKGCSFDAMGKLSGSKIEIPLKDIEQGFKENLIITFSGSKAVISSSNPEGSELIYFCGGGASLAGEYIKGEEQEKENKKPSLQTNVESNSK